jgi:hypothetical protein
LNAFVAWSGGNHSEALREALLAKDAAQDLDDKTRNDFLSSWSPWIEELKRNNQQEQPDSFEASLIADASAAT